MSTIDWDNNLIADGGRFLIQKEVVRHEGTFYTLHLRDPLDRIMLMLLSWSWVGTAVSGCADASVMRSASKPKCFDRSTTQEKMPMGMQFKSPFSKTEADGHQETLNREIRGDDTSDRPDVPPLARQFLEHVARPNEHPPV